MTGPWVLFGDSHTNTFAMARGGVGDKRIVGGAVGGARVCMSDFFEPDGHEFRFRSEKVQHKFMKFLDAAGFKSVSEARGHLIVSLGLAAMPFCASLSRESFEFGGEAGSRRHHHVSHGVLKAIRDDVLKDIVRFYRFCLERNFLAAAIAPPPPQREHHAVENFGPRIFDLVAMFQEPVLNLLAKHKCPVISCPQEVMDAEGFLLPEYTGKNVAHANLEYGVMAMAQFLKRQQMN